jgi:hypothetical protein
VASGIGRVETAIYLSIRKFTFCHLVGIRQSETIESNLSEAITELYVNADVNISLMAVVYGMYTFSCNYGGLFFH